MIGYYVHHHGAGHVTRAGSIATALIRRGHAVTGLSSLPRPAQWPGDWVLLPRDDDPAPGPGADVTAGGALHWSPLGHRGYAERMRLITEWVAVARPAALVVDVSAEVTLLGRLLGLPVVVLAMRGLRDDAPHRSTYAAATRLVAPWPAGCPEPWWPPEWLAKTAHVGALSRFDDRTPAGRDGSTVPTVGTDDPGAPDAAVPTDAAFPPDTAVPPDTVAAGRTRDGAHPAHGAPRGHGLLLWGRGGTWTPDLTDLAAATPGWTWELPRGTADGVWAALRRADVVVTHGGQNAVAEVAAARRAAIVVADPRPFAEQEHTCAALDAAGLAVTLPAWPDSAEWPQLLARARTIGGAGWARWQDGAGAERAAAAIAAVADTGAAGTRGAS